MSRQLLLSPVAALLILLAASASMGAGSAEGMAIREPVPEPEPYRIELTPLTIWVETAHPYNEGVAPRPLSGEAERCFTTVLDAGRGTQVAVHLKTVDLAPGDYIEVADQEGLLLGRFSDASFGEAKEDIWLPSFPSNAVRLSLYSFGSSPGFGLVVDSIAYATPDHGRHVCDTDGRQDVMCFSGGSWQREHSDPVVRLSYVEMPWEYLGTGFLCSPSGHLMTNEHHIANQAQASITWTRFRYQRSGCGSGSASTERQIYGLEFIQASNSLVYDYALLKLERGDIADTVEEYDYLEFTDEDVTLNQELYIPQHPDGGPKVISIEDTYVSDTFTGTIPGNDFGHQGDTDDGSSGSPVLDRATHKVIGLHHKGGCGIWPFYENHAVKSLKILPHIEDFIYLPGWVSCVSPKFGTHGSPVQFIWESALEATSYRVQIDDNWEFSFPSTYSPSGTSISVSLAPGTWYWRARSYNSHGYGDWSEIWAFDVEEGASSIAVSVSLSPSTTTPGGIVNVSGNAMYNDGDPVTAGTAEILTSEDSWTAYLGASGQYSRDIYAPSSSGYVTVYVSDGSITGSGQSYLTVQGGGPGDNFDYDRSTMCHDVDGNYDPVGETHWFRATDDKYVCWTKIDYVYVPVKFKKVWYKPDGELHDTTYSDWSDDPQDYGWDFWNSWMSWTWWWLNGYSNMDWEGRSTVDVYIREEGGSYDYFETQYFIISYDYKEHRMCRDVNGSTYQPEEETNTFTQADEKAVTWSRYTDVCEEVRVRTKFYEPDGSLYADSEYSIDDPGVGHYYPEYMQWTWIWVDGYSAAGKCGSWRLEKYEEDPWGNWDLLYEDTFLILESPNVDPSATVSWDPEDPVEGETIELRCDAADNTYLEEVTLFWNDGSLHSQTAADVFSNAHVIAVTIGPYTEAKEIECYARAVDTSGNEYESSHHVITILDGDAEGPSISDVQIVEESGNGDGVLQSLETIRVSCAVEDSSGVGVVQFLVDSSEVPLDGDYFAVLGPLEAGSHELVIRASDADNSPASSILETSFDVYSPPDCTISGGEDSVCEGADTQWCGPDIPDYSFSWSGPDGFTPSFDRCVTVAIAGEYALTVTDVYGGTGTCERILTVYGAPECLIEPPVELPVCGSTGNTYEGPEGFAGYEWSIDSETGDWVITGGQYERTVTYDAGGYGWVSLTLEVTDENGCHGTCDMLFDPQSPVEGSFYAVENVAGTVTLRWSLASTAGISGLNLYRALSESGPYSRLNSDVLEPASVAMYEDSSVWPGTTFWYDLRVVLPDGTEDTVTGSPVFVTTTGSLALALHAPSPNPTRGSTGLVFDVPTYSGFLELAIHDLRGRLVRRLATGPHGPGRYHAEWDGRDSSGRQVSAGVYFVRLLVADATRTSKVLVIR